MLIFILPRDREILIFYSSARIYTETHSAAPTDLSLSRFQGSTRPPGGHLSIKMSFFYNGFWDHSSGLTLTLTLALTPTLTHRSFFDFTDRRHRRDRQEDPKPPQGQHQEAAGGGLHPGQG